MAIRRHNNLNSGFTLVELAVVLVILGLLVGGILTGQNLIRAAELKKLGKEAENYRMAVYTFLMEYDAYPGDLEIATRYWGEADTNPATCYAMDKSDIAGTCNGNGDGMVADATEREEHYLFWHHLQKAGLIGGTYSGAWDADCTGFCESSHMPGVNAPVSALGNQTGWAAYFKGESDGSESNPNWFLGQYGHILTFGSRHQGAAPNKPAISPAEAYGIDKKLDDGLPARGDVVVRAGNYPDLENCTETAPGSGLETDKDDLDSVYRLSHGDEAACNLILRNLL